MLVLEGDVNTAMLFLFSAATSDVKKGDTVDVFIDSPGGYAETGTDISDRISAFQQMGATFRCTALRAASAAFMIWSVCSDRYVMAYGKVMFHYPWRLHKDDQHKVTVVQAQEIYETLYKFREDFRKRLQKAMLFVPAEKIEEAAEADRIFLGLEFCKVFAKGFCKVVYKSDYLEGKFK